MRSNGTPDESEHRRRLAVRRVFEGYSTEEVADFLGVDPSTVRRRGALFRDRGEQALIARPVPGRPPKLTPAPEKIIRRRLDESPTVHGFETARWTAPRLGRLIRDGFDVRLPPKYLSAWSRARGSSPQKPERVPRGRDPKAIAAWLESDRPRIEKRPGGSAPLSP